MGALIDALGRAQRQQQIASPDPQRSETTRAAAQEPAASRAQQRLGDVTATPDKYSEANRIAQQRGADPNVVLQDLSIFKDHQKRKKRGHVLNRTPVLSEWLARSDENAGLAQDDLENLSLAEEIWKNIKIKKAQVEWTQRQFDAIGKPEGSPEQLMADEARRQLEALGEDEATGLGSTLVAAAGVSTQMLLDLFSPEGAALVPGGALTGAAAGAVGLGPGIVAGAGTGAVILGIPATFAVRTFQNEGAAMYADLVEAGMDRQAAVLPSYAVGAVSGALETIGVTLIGKPFVQVGRRVLRRKVTERLTTPDNIRLLTQFARDYGIGVGAEVTTEFLQELTAVAARQLIALKDEDVEALSADEIGDRLAAITEETLKAMVVLGPIGPALNYTSQVSQSRKAQKKQQQMDQMNTVAAESELKKNTPQKYGEVVGEQMTAGGQEAIWIDGQILMDWAGETGDSGMLGNLGIDRNTIEDAVRRGDGVRIEASRWAEHVLGTEHYEAIAQDQRFTEEGMSFNEAQEFEALGLDAELNAVNTAVVPEEVTTLETSDQPVTSPPEQTVDEIAVQIAEMELGANALYATAEEAGMTAQEFANYQAAHQKKRDDATASMHDKRLKQQEREATVKWQRLEKKALKEAREGLRRTQTYRALNSIPAQQLNREQVEAAVAELGITLEDLPVLNKRGKRLYAPVKGRRGVNLDAYAQQNGYVDGNEMILDFATAQPFEEAIEQTARKQMLENHGDLNNMIEAIGQARAELFSDGQRQVLMMELNSLRAARRAGRVKNSVLRQEAKERMRLLKVSEIQPRRFEQAARRNAAAARRAIRRADRRAAEGHKFAQVLNFEMFRIAIGQKRQIERKLDFLRKMNKRTRPGEKKPLLPVRYNEAIQQKLAQYELAKRRPKDEKNSLQELDNDVINGAPMTAPSLTLGQKFWQDVTLAEFNDLHDTIKSINKAGRSEKTLRDKEAKRTFDEEVEFLVGRILEMDPKDLLDTRGTWNAARQGGRELLAWILDADSMLRHVDGFTDLGPMFQAIKGRHDIAFSEKFLPREKQVNEEIAEIFALLPREERINLNKKVEGQGFTKQEQLVAIFNMLNPEGHLAVSEHPKFATEAQQQAAIDNMTEGDFNFIRAMMEYLDSFWLEIKAKEEARRDYTPKRVEARPIETPHGRLEGGYYPLFYDRRLSIFEDVKSFEEVAQDGAQGKYAGAHTARWHTEQRANNVGQPVFLDLRGINRHFNQLIWDLEMGDPLNDALKVLHDKRIATAFKTQGFDHYHEALKLWLRDAITRETYSGSILERTAHYFRTGLTISKLGFNLKTAMLQPLGLVSTAAQLGKYNTLTAMYVAAQPKIYNRIREMSPVMAARARQWSVDQQVAEDFANSAAGRNLFLADTRQFLIKAGFFLIQKMQATVDVITWWSAYRKGMKDNQNDQRKAIQFADLMVNRTQGSAIFAQRTAAARGSTSTNRPQSEVIRALTPFMNYFAAKNNVLFERTKRTNFKSLWSWMNYITDVAMLFWLEGAVIALMIGTDDDDTLIEGSLKEAFWSLPAGLPIIRDIAGAARGFGAGRVGGIGEDLRDVAQGLVEAINEGEWERLTEGGINLSFQFMRLPGAAQINRTIRAANERGEVDEIEYIFGVRR